jgi:hypothetical protein
MGHAPFVRWEIQLAIIVAADRLGHDAQMQS